MDISYGTTLNVFFLMIDSNNTQGLVTYFLVIEYSTPRFLLTINQDQHERESSKRPF